MTDNEIEEIRKSEPTDPAAAADAIEGCRNATLQLTFVGERFEAQIENLAGIFAAVPADQRARLAAQLVADAGGPTFLDAVARLHRQAASVASVTGTFHRLLESGEIEGVNRG